MTGGTAAHPSLPWSSGASATLLPGCSVEVLIPDFKGSLEALKIVLDARPEILNHNVETVPRLFKQVQPQDHYEWSAAILSGAKKLDPEVLTKSGIMVGLGEEMEEVKAVMRDQRSWGVDILTIGQYLQPSKKHLPIARYYTLEEFKELREYGGEIGFKWVESGAAGEVIVPCRGAGASVEQRAQKVVWGNQNAIISG